MKSAKGRSFADAGGLISYGGDFAEQYPQAAGYIDRILKGDKPADLPIQMPTKIALVINQTQPRHLASTCRCISNKLQTR